MKQILYKLAPRLGKLTKSHNKEKIVIYANIYTESYDNRIKCTTYIRLQESRKVRKNFYKTIRNLFNVLRKWTWKKNENVTSDILHENRGLIVTQLFWSLWNVLLTLEACDSFKKGSVDRLDVTIKRNWIRCITNIKIIFYWH